MTPIRALLVRRARAVLADWFPSVPPAQQARIAAAMEGRTLSPAPGPGRGKPWPGAGHVTESPSPVSVATEAGSGGAVPCPAPCPPAHPELLLNWRPEFGPHRGEFSDVVMAEMVTAWGAP